MTGINAISIGMLLADSLSPDPPVGSSPSTQSAHPRWLRRSTPMTALSHSASPEQLPGGAQISGIEWVARRSSGGKAC